MADQKTFTFLLMDAPYESARSTTALRVIDAAIRRGHNVNVFGYEGAVMLPFGKQAPHANAVHGRSVEAEDHPTPKDWIAAMMKAAEQKGVKLDWINCGLCVDERGAQESIPGVRRGTPADFWKSAETTTNTLVIPTK